MVIKTILFDFGGVIYKTPSMRWMKRFKDILGVEDRPEIAEMIANPHESVMVRDICLGKRSEDTMWDLMAEKWHIRPSVIKFFRRKMVSKRSLNKPILDLMKELGLTYQIAILSNAGDKSRVLMEDVFHLDRLVEEIIISAEEGVIKPDPKIYQITMERLSTSPERTLLIDDYTENVLSARDFGMRAVQFIDNQQAIQRVREILAEEF